MSFCPRTPPSKSAPARSHPLWNIPPVFKRHNLFSNRDIAGEKRRRKEEKKRSSVISGLLGQVVLPKISHPTKMATPRRARMTHQLTRSGCDRGRVERIIRRHDIGSVIAFSVFASRYRRRTVKTRREFHRGSRRGRLWWCWKDS